MADSGVTEYMTVDRKNRCAWTTTDPLYLEYHDVEWGTPSYDDRHLFEMLVLESMQSGLSWITILKKRETFRSAFKNFEIESIARFNEKKIEQLLANPGIIRNRAKIVAAIENAKATVKVLKSSDSLAAFLWESVGGHPRQNRWKSGADIPAQTEQSQQLAKRLKEHGFKFLGPTTCYAFMQAVGMVNDHLVTCFRHKELR
jgi:DNA-3-methyladenine glycosylase I